jgi:pimeloyl-ACP methyl ester carboxylesterase
VKLRLYHHSDGARIAYREAGTGPPLALIHSAGLSHREFEPLVEELSDRFRLVLPDLPLHGDSEDRPRHPYTQEWVVEVLSGFIREACGPRPVVGGHDLGAGLLLRAIASNQLSPSKLVLLSAALHRGREGDRRSRAVRAVARAGAIPGLDRLAARGVTLAFRPSLGEQLSARHNPAARDLIRHALVDLPRNSNRARSWAKAARRWPLGPDTDLLDAYRHVDCPVLLLWADEDPTHPLTIADELVDLLPEALLRTLPGTGFLMAYDDPVGMAREIAAFCL